MFLKIICQNLFRNSKYIAEDLYDAVLALLSKDINSDFNLSKTVVKWDGVITDVHFPRITGKIENQGDLYPYGIEVMVICHQKGIPFVVCTDMHRHHCGWIKSIAKRLGAKGFIPDKGNRSYDPNDLFWENALSLLFS